MTIDNHVAAESGAAPEWWGALASTPGVAVSKKAAYWENDEFGADSIIRTLHTDTGVSSLGGPALRGVKVLWNRESKVIYGLWPLGLAVCGHRRIAHGGLSALMIDEMCGQAYFHFFYAERGPGVTANLNINYRKPIPALQSVLITVTVEAVEGRKVSLSAVVSDGPDGTVFLEAKALFIVVKKEAEAPGQLSSASLTNLAAAAEAAELSAGASPVVQ